MQSRGCSARRSNGILPNSWSIAPARWWRGMRRPRGRKDWQEKSRRYCEREERCHDRPIDQPVAGPSFERSEKPLLQCRRAGARCRHSLQGRREDQRRGVLRQRGLGAGHGGQRQGSLRQPLDDQGAWTGGTVFPRQGIVLRRYLVIARSEATKQSSLPLCDSALDCFASLAMMVWTASLKRHLVPKRGRRSATEGSRP